MKRGLSALASAALLGGSLFLGAGAAQAFSCPAGQHVISMGGINDCMPDASGGGTGGAITYDGGGQPNTGAPAPIQVPAYNNPVWTPGPIAAPPAYQPAPQAPAAVPAPVAVRPYVPAAPQAPVYTGTTGGNGYRPAATGQAPAFTPAGGGAAVTKNAQGVWVNPETGVAADAEVAAQASAAEAAPAEAPAEAPAAAPAVVIPTTEVQAVDALRSATATPAEKDAALAIVKSKIDAVLTTALDKALDNH